MISIRPIETGVVDVSLGGGGERAEEDDVVRGLQQQQQLQQLQQLQQQQQQLLESLFRIGVHCWCHEWGI